jgi:NADH-quinone oxidoreductase subunit L
MTCFYMFRLYFLTFHGKFRGTHDQEHHLHESPRSMTIPLVVLAVLAAVGGFMGVPEVFMKNSDWIGHFLSPVLGLSYTGLSESQELGLMIVSVAILILVILITRSIYVTRALLPAEEGAELPPLQKVIYNKYYVDEIYEACITKPLNFLASVFDRFIESQFIDAIVNGVGTVVNRTSNGLRYLQSGNIGFYLFAMVLSIILMLFVKFF